MRKFIDIIEGKRLPLYKGQVDTMRGSYGAFIVTMQPEDFIRLTTHDEAEYEAIVSRAQAYSPEEYREKMGRDDGFGKFQMPFLNVCLPSGRIKGHEGRHRAAMVLKDGGTSIPVTIYPYSDVRTFAKLTHWDFSGEDGEDLPDIVTRVEFPDHEAARAHIDRLEAEKKAKLDADDWSDTFARGKVEYEGGHKLKGAPERNISAWETAAWRVSDFPDQLVGQFDPSYVVPKSRLRIGLVKGYRHHTIKEAEASEVRQSNQTLYHGTLKDNLPAILADGLEPTVGEFTRNCYAIGDDDEGNYDPVVFVADKAGLYRCYAAILGALEAKFGRDSRTLDMVREHGALLVIKGRIDDFKYRFDPEKDEGYDYDDHPGQAEPGDFYSTDHVLIDHAITGKNLISFLSRNGVQFSDETSLRFMVDKGVKALIKAGMTPQAALARARQLGVKGIRMFLIRVEKGGDTSSYTGPTWPS